MSFQAYLDTIREKTGKSPEDFRKLAEQRGCLRPGIKAGEIIAWLKSDFGLGHGHAMAIYSVLRSAIEAPATRKQRLDEHFKGRRAMWNGTFAQIVRKANAFGKDQPAVKVGDSYISLLRMGRKFAIVKVGVDFLDLGLKLKNNAPADARLVEAGDWNRMVTHRVRLESPNDLDGNVLRWLKAAYDAATT